VRGSSGAEVRKQPGSRSNPELPLDQAIRCSKAVSSLGPSVSGSLTVFEIVSQLEVPALYGDAAVLIASSRPTETAGRSGTGFWRESRTMCSSNSSVKDICCPGTSSEVHVLLRHPAQHVAGDPKPPLSMQSGSLRRAPSGGENAISTAGGGSDTPICASKDGPGGCAREKLEGR
jgi:hypothetical protein